ncbi:hypothetical protein [Poseidonocella pacifica]|uniref:hypothetical protein n=1 Tax=Poseidonocella pacifica TaxID=871651 RepID=UPI00111442E7|nr:hypothetical protein [Poseidonocella pacifica]
MGGIILEKWKHIIALCGVIVAAVGIYLSYSAGEDDQKLFAPEVIDQSEGSGNSVVIGNSNKVDRQ